MKIKKNLKIKLQDYQNKVYNIKKLKKNIFNSSIIYNKN